MGAARYCSMLVTQLMHAAAVPAKATRSALGDCKQQADPSFAAAVNSCRQPQADGSTAERAGSEQSPGSGVQELLHGSLFVGELLGRLSVRGHAKWVAAALWRLLFSQAAVQDIAADGAHVADSSEAAATRREPLSTAHVAAAVGAVAHSAGLQKLLQALLSSASWPAVPQAGGSMQHDDVLLRVVANVWHRPEVRQASAAGMPGHICTIRLLSHLFNGSAGTDCRCMHGAEPFEVRVWSCCEAGPATAGMHEQGELSPAAALLT